MGVRFDSAALLTVRYLDVIVLALALPVFVAATLPLGAWAVASILWLALRGIRATLDRRAAEAASSRAVAGLMVGGAIGRTWIAALTVVATGLVLGEAAGLATVLLILTLFSVHLSARLIERGVSG